MVDVRDVDELRSRGLPLALRWPRGRLTAKDEARPHPYTGEDGACNESLPQSGREQSIAQSHWPSDDPMSGRQRRQLATRNLCRASPLVVIRLDAAVTRAARLPLRVGDDGEERLAHVAFVARLTQAAAQPVRPRDRLLNVIAGLCIASGGVLFLLARRTLALIAAGGIASPPGSPVSNVAYTDAVVLRTRVGLWLVVVGAILALASAISHRFRPRA